MSNEVIVRSIYTYFVRLCPVNVTILKALRGTFYPRHGNMHDPESQPTTNADNTSQTPAYHRQYSMYEDNEAKVTMDLN